MIHITPTNYYKQLQLRTDSKELAGIKLRGLTEVGLSEMSSKSSYEFIGVYYFEIDPIPLLWINK